MSQISDPMIMNGKLCLVTGSTSGIGNAICKRLAEMNSKIVMISRDRVRGEVALEEIRRSSGSDSVDLMIADLSSQKSIHRLVNDFKKKYYKLDVLVNNAAVFIGKRSFTSDNIETTFAVNHLAPFLLTNLLLDLLKTSAPARIINVTSSAHSRFSIDFNNLQGEKKFSAYRAYSMSKLANILFTYELAKRLDGTGITVNCLHPGIVATNLMRESPSLIRLAWKIMSPFFISPDKSADICAYLASSPLVKNTTGKYFVKHKNWISGERRIVEKKSSSRSYIEEDMKCLWQESARLTNTN